MAAQLVRQKLQQTADQPDALPADPSDLFDWMQDNVARVHARYQSYLERRQAGGPRQYFSSRSHALYFLRNVAPTKLVDGAWLYGLCAHAGNPRLSDLVATYVEELGEGQADKNHVKLYRDLLTRHGLDGDAELPDALYEQGLVQLALGWNAADFLPEIVGFNLAYEQLPLHLLISAYELNELGIDPYYFTLHVTVDNAGTGHARRACQAALALAPRIHDGDEYWQRVRAGARLGDVGVSTLDVIQGFDLEAEVLRILRRKATAGDGAHGDFCKIGGRSVNEWLGDPESMPDFLRAMEQGGWIQRHQPAENSRFWQLLQGERAEMFGVFSAYELQVIHDWLRGDGAADGAAYAAQPQPPARRRPMSFRAAQRLKALQASAAPAAPSGAELLDPDLAAFEARYPALGAEDKHALLVQAMAPALHWTPVGLHATRVFTAGA